VLEAASRNQSAALEVANLRRPEDFNGAFATMISKQVEALLVVVGPLTYLLRQEIADAASRSPAGYDKCEAASRKFLIRPWTISTGNRRAVRSRFSQIVLAPPARIVQIRRSSQQTCGAASHFVIAGRRCLKAHIGNLCRSK